MSAGVTRYLQISADCRYLQKLLSADIYESAYNTLLSARCTIQFSCLRLRRRTQIARYLRTDRVRCVRRVRCDCVAARRRRRRRHVVIRHRRRPAPPPPAGRHRCFQGGRGGVIVVVVIRVRAPHVVKETPGVVVVRMGEDDRPSPTTTRHVLPLWRRRRDAVRQGQRREGWHGGAAPGLGIFRGRRR